MFTGYAPTGQQMMDGSLVDEVQKQQQNLIDAARAEAIQQDPTLNYAQRKIAKGLLGAKQDWQNAYDAGDATGMANAALAGQSLREQGDAIGWSGNGYGSDVSLHEAAMNLLNNDAKAVNNILYNLKDSNDVYQQKVVEYLDKGYAIDSAKRMAKQRSDENTANNANQLRDAFRMYGMDERGAITPQGADILASLGTSGQGKLANFYANMLPNPAQNWQFENALTTAANAQKNRLQAMELQNQYRQAERREGYAHDEQMLGLRAKLNAAARNMDLKQKEDFLYRNYLTLTGGNEEAARQLTAQHLLGGGGGSRAGGAVAAGSSNKDRLAMYEKVNNRLEAIEKRYGMDKEGLNNDTEYQQLKQLSMELMVGKPEVDNSVNYYRFLEEVRNDMQENSDKGNPNSKEKMRQFIRDYYHVPDEWIDDIDWDVYYPKKKNDEAAKKQEPKQEAAGESELQQYVTNMSTPQTQVWQPANLGTYWQVR